MKAKIYFGVSLSCTVAGFLLMFALLGSEGKFDNPTALGELWAGGSIFGIFGIIMAAVSAKAYARWGSEMGTSHEHRIELWLLALGVFAILGLTTWGSLYVPTTLGLITREQAPPAALLFVFLVGWLLVRHSPDSYTDGA